jgi:hypothetical protein
LAIIGTIKVAPRDHLQGRASQKEIARVCPSLRDRKYVMLDEQQVGKSL